ncbi:complement C1q tumor necrosis factor-related protein 2 [Astyanax mexicanus]|uniref:C1q and TNF related 2 n=3 Tax=Astyanax mexicanus TaxID=7994 RepID=A0A8B9JC84_ASTMX|nr:complement C1q tumor necrosis factor-related protein 2 [Astyanax mexicanus]KAG9272269.1 complement C1q tumor necrosis factor-related protein 2 [Astyanax mexicanus]
MRLLLCARDAESTNVSFLAGLSSHPNKTNVFFSHSCIMHQTLLATFLLSLSSVLTVNSAIKKGHNLTIHSSQLVCSLPGPQGPPGSPGPSGPSGSNGRMGLPGSDGQDGKDGDRGLKGVKGEQGRQGNPGKPGLKGRQGVVGRAGPRGLKGVRGSAGAPGTSGLKGENGDMGEAGTAGGCDCGKQARSAFSVAITKSYPKERMPIRFERILMNEGNNYNTSSGKFTCTIPGVYYFTYDITLANKHLAIGLVHNGQYKIKTFDANTGNHDVASGSTVLRLQKGDQVWLQIFYSEQNGLFFDPFWTDSLFTGFLIYAEQITPTKVVPTTASPGSS